MKTELRWMVPAIVLVGIQQIACLLLEFSLNIAGRPPFLDYGFLALGACFTIFTALSAHALVQCVLRKPHSPSAHMWAYFAERKSKIATFAIGGVLGWLQLAALTWTKTVQPKLGPMWADPMLANFDHWLVGTDAWRPVYAAFAPAGRAIDFLYALWLVLLLVTFGCVLMTASSRAKSAVTMAFFTTTAFLGVIGQFLLPSGGPIYWSRLGLGHRFDALPLQPHAEKIADYLWLKYMGDAVDFGTGISAFPSMHVALTAWIVLAVHQLFPRFRPLAWFYFLVVVIGSVFLGWHYFADALGGAAGAIACWYLAVQITKRYNPRLPFLAPSAARQN